jgi:hypothetical protein
MNATPLRAGDYILSADIQPLDRPSGQYHLVFRTQLLSAKVPSEQLTAFSFTGDAQSLLALRDLIDLALQESHV